MIKTDYKPKLSDKAIFSSSRKRAALPVIIMAVIAIALAAWGLWAEVNEQPANTEQQMPLSTIDADDSTAILDSSNQQPEKVLKEIQLNFQHDRKQKLESKNQAKR